MIDWVACFWNADLKEIHTKNILEDFLNEAASLTDKHWSHELDLAYVLTHN